MVAKGRGEGEERKRGQEGGKRGREERKERREKGERGKEEGKRKTRELCCQLGLWWRRWVGREIWGV